MDPGTTWQAAENYTAQVVVGGVLRVLVHECYQIQKLFYMLDQVRTTTCSRNQHIAGSHEYVRTNINYDQTVSKGELWKVTSILAHIQLVGKTVVTSCNSLSSTAPQKETAYPLAVTSTFPQQLPIKNQFSVSLEWPILEVSRE